jgi:hypothetical protein
MHLDGVSTMEWWFCKNVRTDQKRHMLALFHHAMLFNMLQESRKVLIRG